MGGGALTLGDMRERLGKVLCLCGWRSHEQGDGKETEASEWRNVLRGDHIRGEG